MTTEQIIARHISGVSYDALSADDIKVAKKHLLTLFGAIIAGWNSDGCKVCADIADELGGKEESSILMWNRKVPAQQAAFVNAVMCRALDIGDHISPGVQIGSAVLPAALAAAEMVGGCSGKDLILAVVAGTDLSLRLKLTEAEYDGFCPTGVVAMFATVSAAAKLMKLDENQTLHALALAFNRCGGSFQSNIDGSLAVRIIEGWVAQNGVECARLASRGITGPKNFLDGVYGYYHLFGRDRADKSKLLKDLGTEWLGKTLSYKKYPSCGQTLGSTELIVKLMQENSVKTGEIDSIKVIINPFTAKLVGKPFEIGENPKVDAQFNVGYCVANAAVRYPVLLKHFEPEYIKDEEVLSFCRERVEVIVDPKLQERGHYSSDMVLLLKDGREFSASIDIPPGSVGNEMQEEDFISRFRDCIDFCGREDIAQRADAIFAAIEDFENIEDVRDFIRLFQ